MRGIARLPALLTLGQWSIARAAKEHGLSLVHDPTGTAPLLLCGARRVVTIHDVIPFIYPQTSTLLDKLIYRAWLPFATHQLDAIITDSTCSKVDIVRYLGVRPEMVTAIPAAANADYHPRSPADIQPTLERYGIQQPFLLSVSSIEARKNLPRLLEAFTILRQWQPGLKLVIVGARRWKFSSVFETVKQLQLEPDVHFTGFVAEADLPALYNGADLFVFPSLYEGFGLPVLESMASGTPVITSRVSSLPEVAGNAAILVDPYNVDTIAQAMWQVLQDPQLAANLREKGLAWANQFSWERTARETLAVYERVLQGTG
jgi:glycosyltransferase involved in cell wall biosynthesis